MTQTDMNVCAGMKAEASEAMLGRLLAEVNARLEQSQRDELTSVQAQWLAYRNAHCAWQARFFDGGSMRPLISADCIDQLTRSRIRELRVNLCEGMTDGCAAAQRYATGGR